MPDRSGTWGAELSDDDFACAVAEAGLRQALPDGRLVWDWSGDATEPARELADRWARRRAKTKDLRVSMATFAIDAWRWLSRPAVGIAALMIVHPLVDSHATPERWAWPWQIVDLTSGSRLRAPLQASRWHRRTIELIDIDERVPAGLVIVDGPLAEALVMLARDHKRLRANAVLVAGAIEPQARAYPWLAWSLAEQLGASMILLDAPDDDAELVTLVEETSVELSHDLSIDRALLVAARRLGIEPPMLHADPDAVESARLSNRATHLVKVLTDLGAQSGTGSHGLESTRGPLETLVQRLEWHSEGRGATTVGAMGREQRDRDADSANKMPPRYLQATLTKDGDADAAQVVTPDAMYAVRVKIGEFDPQVLQVTNPIHEPYAGVTVPVDVIISDRNLLPVPLRATIALPPNGSSTEATFRLHAKPGVARLELRVTVLHRGRVLQSGIIRAAIDGTDALRFDVDAVGRHHLAGLEHRRAFDAAFVCNHTTDGEPGVVGAVPDGVGYISIDPSHLAALTQTLGETISNIAIQPERYRELRSDGTVEVLRELALRGAAFHRLLVKHAAIGKGLLDAERIQIVAAKPNTFLPLELVYSLKPPKKDAPLCENAEAALRDGTCTDACGGRDGSRVCPLGFWALSKVIERHEHRPALAQTTGGAEFRAQRYPETTTPERSKLDAPKSVVFAASARIDRVEKETSATLAANLEKTFGAGNIKKVTTWDEWIPAVTAAARPNLLVVVPHTKSSDHNDQVLEIGEASELRALEVVEEHVIGDPAAPPSPIVFLLGCETSASKVPNESFVSILRDREAALVISTISTILGRDAAPVAAALAQAIMDIHKQGGGFAGEAMTRMRRQMLLQGKAMVLAVTMYGDADWMLAPA